MSIGKWATIVMNVLPEVHMKIALKLVNEFHEEYGVRVIIDTQVYEPAGIVRLDLSIYSGIKVLSLPFKPYN